MLVCFLQVNDVCLEPTTGLRQLIDKHMSRTMPLSTTADKRQLQSFSGNSLAPAPLLCSEVMIMVWPPSLFLLSKCKILFIRIMHYVRLFIMQFGHSIFRACVVSTMVNIWFTTRFVEFYTFSIYPCVCAKQC
jgi:hypothetical protein